MWEKTKDYDQVRGFFENLNIKRFLVFSLIGILVINASIISSYIIVENYGSMTLSPGERYTVNIPFIAEEGEEEEEISPNSPIACGKAEKTNGEPVEGVNVSAYLGSDFAGSKITNESGDYCIVLPEINRNRIFNVQIGYDDEILELGSNDYEVSFEENQVYEKGVDEKAILFLTIKNKDARIDNGRIEARIRKYNEIEEGWEDVFGYKKYYLNISRNETYSLPNQEIEINWEFPEDVELGEYQFYFRPSFNGETKGPYSADFRIE